MLHLEALGEEILVRVNVDDLCQLIYEGRDSKESLPETLGAYCSLLADHYWDDKKIGMPVHRRPRELSVQGYSRGRAGRQTLGLQGMLEKAD